MKKTLKKVLSVFLVVVITLTAAPLSGFVGLELPDWLDFSIMSKAATSGTCGDNLTWTFDELTGTLTIDGTGEMNDFDKSNRPWENYKDDIISIKIGNSVTSIGYAAFTYCQSLVSVIIPNSVKSIRDTAFASCASLTSVNIPDSVKMFGDQVFASCISLTKINVDDNNPVLSSIDGILYTKDKKTLICYPAGKTTISSFSIPDSVTTISLYAFAFCYSLTDITVGGSVTSIGTSAFGFCFSLTNINVSKDNANYSSEDGVLLNKDKTSLICYPAGKTASSYTISNGIISISSFAFYPCTSLTSVIIPDSVISIGPFAFNDCSSLTDVYYTDSENRWNSITIGSNNECLTNATIHYNYIPMGDTVANCEVGDLIEFGSYPQSKVTNTSLISTLNGLVTSWTSYGYYTGTGNIDGQMKPSDYMKYTDVTYNGTKYRGVYFSSYRPNYTFYTSSSSNSFQSDYGYYTGTTYWFKYEPVVWRVLDPEEGYVMCESIIDSQPYQNTVYYDGSNYYQDTTCTTYANDYATSSIRDWLNDDFYNTAFTSTEKTQIGISTCDNSCWNDSYPEYDSATTYDKIFFLSYEDAINSDYGFNSSSSSYDKARKAQGTDYAICQGLIDDYSYYSEWWLRSPVDNSIRACGVSGNGLADNSFFYFVYTAHEGVRPAFKFNPKSEIPESETYIGVFTTERSMTIGENEKFSVAFGLIENGETKGNWKEMSIVISNPDIISISNYKETSSGFIIDITGKQSGTTNVIVSDTESGVSTTFEIGVYSRYSQTRTYDMKNMPLFQKEKVNANIYNMNGLYVNNFNYTYAGDDYNVSFDVYNSYPNYAAVDIYDADGKWIGCEKIDPMLQVTNAWDILEGTFYLITDISTGNFLNYTSHFVSKHTEMNFKVPKGGYFNISNNQEASRGTQLYFLSDIFTKCVSKLVPAIDGGLKDKFIDNLVLAIVEESIQEEVAEVIYGTLTKESIKFLSKFTLSNLTDTTIEIVELFENFLNSLDISWKHIAKITVGGIEGVLSKIFTSVSKPLKAGFTASEITNYYEMFTYAVDSMEYSYASVYTDMDNVQNIDGVEVITHGNIDVDTHLQVFKIFNESAAAKAGNKAYQIYNISFVKNDKTVQPSGLVEVRIPIPKGMKKDTCHIHRQEADGSWTVLTGKVEGNYLVFETDHFSMYMITGELYELTLKSLPDKLTYTQGEVFDSTGLVLEQNGELITDGFTASPSVLDEVGTQNVKVFYGEKYVEFDVEVLAPEPEYNYTFSIQNPSRTEIRNKDGIYLHAVVDGIAPEGCYIEWERSNANFISGEMSEDTYLIVADDKGWTTFTAILCAEDGTELARDSVEMYSKSGFFDKIGGFFRSLFGMTEIYDY